MAGLGQVAPALPVRDIAAAVAYYEERFGFACPHRDDGFAVLTRDAARIHLWTKPCAGTRAAAAQSEPGLVRDDTCEVGEAAQFETDEVDALYAELQGTGVLHRVSTDGVTTTDFGTREFATTDLDGNLIEFYRWVR